MRKSRPLYVQQWGAHKFMDKESANKMRKAATRNSFSPVNILMEAIPYMMIVVAVLGLYDIRQYRLAEEAENSEVNKEN